MSNPEPAPVSRGGFAQLFERPALAGAADYLVRCNHCGHVKPKSRPGGCPAGHAAGWSYAGPNAPG